MTASEDWLRPAPAEEAKDAAGKSTMRGGAGSGA